MKIDINKLDPRERPIVVNKDTGKEFEVIAKGGDFLILKGDPLPNKGKMTEKRKVEQSDFGHYELKGVP